VRRLGKTGLEWVCGCIFAFGLGLAVDALTAGECGIARVAQGMVLGVPIGAVIGVAVVGWIADKPRRLNRLGIVLGWLLGFCGSVLGMLLGEHLSNSSFLVIGLGVACSGAFACMGWHVGKGVGKAFRYGSS
jgi:hypothetical protein